MLKSVEVALLYFSFLALFIIPRLNFGLATIVTFFSSIYKNFIEPGKRSINVGKKYCQVCRYSVYIPVPNLTRLYTLTHDKGEGKVMSSPTCRESRGIVDGCLGILERTNTLTTTTIKQLSGARRMR